MPPSHHRRSSKTASSRYPPVTRWRSPRRLPPYGGAPESEAPTGARGLARQRPADLDRVGQRAHPGGGLSPVMGNSRWAPETTTCMPRMSRESDGSGVLSEARRRPSVPTARTRKSRGWPIRSSNSAKKSSSTCLRTGKRAVRWTSPAARVSQAYTEPTAPKSMPSCMETPAARARGLTTARPPSGAPQGERTCGGGCGSKPCPPAAAIPRIPRMACARTRPPQVPTQAQPTQYVP